VNKKRTPPQDKQEGEGASERSFFVVDPGAGQGLGRQVIFNLFV